VLNARIEASQLKEHKSASVIFSTMLEVRSSTPSYISTVDFSMPVLQALIWSPDVSRQQYAFSSTYARTYSFDSRSE